MNKMILSFEIICLLKWILENKKDDLSNILKKALQEGCLDLYDEISSEANDVLLFSETIAQYVAIFEELIDDYLKENIEHKEHAKVIDVFLKRVLTSNLDRNLILKCLKHSDYKKAAENLSEEDLLKIMYKRLLTEWIPSPLDPSA